MADNSDSLFTKIINGDVPCHKIYEDDKTLAFLDIHPRLPGHSLVIPKRQIEFVWDLPPADYEHLMLTVQKVALRLRDVTGLPYVYSSIVGTDVPHAHVHLIPFANSQDLHQNPGRDAVEPDHVSLAALAKKLMF